MSEFVAGAFVDVKPDTKGFRDDLKKKVNASIKSAGVFQIPVAFEIKAFKKQLQDAARQAKPTIPIQIGGNVATIRKDLNDKIKKATEGLAFKVPVEFTQTGSGARGGPGARGGAGGTAAASDRAASSTKKLTEAERLRADVQKTLIALDTRAAVTRDLLTAAEQQGLSVEERGQRLRDARTSANAAVRASTEQLARASAVLTGEQRKGLETAKAEALATRASVLEKQKDFAISSARAKAAAASTKAHEEAVLAMGVEIPEITSLNRLHIVENELLAAEAALKRATNKARELGLVSQAAENQVLLRNIALRKEAIVAQRLELKGEGKRLTQQKTGARGAGATILSLLGLRGATLAASAAFLGGAAAAAIFTKSLKSFADFEAELNTFQAIAGATAEQMEAVSEQAKLLGEDITLPAVSAADAAVAMTELARAGLSVQDSIIGARGVLELATAAQIDNAEAATLVATGLNAFSLAGDQAVHVADLLANAANAAQGSISEMGAALQQAAAISHQVGISLDDTVAILTLFARNGLRGSDAGTSLRTALARLIAPTKKAADLIDQLGLNIRDAQGNIRPDVFAQFGKATEDLPPALRDMAAEIIAGQDSIRAFAIGAREGARGLELAKLQMAQTGTAAQVAAARSKGLAGQFGALGSNAETLGTQLGELASGPVGALAQGLNDLLTVANKLATGDFAGAGKGFLDAQVRETEQRVKGIGHLFTSIVVPGDLSKGLNELFGPVTKEKSRVEILLEELDQLQKLRITAFKPGAELDIGPITKQIKEVRAELKAAQIDVGLLIPVTPAEKALAPLREALRAAEEFKRALEAGPGEPDTGQLIAVDKLIDDAKAKLKVRIKELKKDAANELASGESLTKAFSHTFELIAENIKLATPEVLGGIDDDIRKIAGAVARGGPEMGAAGKAIAKSIQVAIDTAIAEDDPELAAILKEKADKIAALFAGFSADALKNIKIPITAEDIAEALLPERVAVARADAFGTIAEQIAARQAELAKLIKKSHEVKKGSEEEIKVLNDIDAKRDEIESLIKGASSGADTRVTDAISAEEQRRLNRLAIAETTETLKDDIRRERELRAFYVKQIAIVRARVQDKQARNDAIAELNQKIFDLDLDIAADIKARAEHIFDEAAEAAAETETLADDLRVAERKVRFWRRQVEILEDLVRKRKASVARLKAARDALDAAEEEAEAARRSRRQQQRERRDERIELKIQIAQDNENIRAEIRFREIQIRNTQQLISQTRRGSLQRLRLIAELRRQQRELRDLKKEKDAANNAAAQLFFSFLTTQQGFGANLLGNLLPSGAFGTSVADKLAGKGGGGGGGGGNFQMGGPDLGLARLGGAGGPLTIDAAGAALGRDAGVIPGPTRGQQSVELDLLRQILQVLRNANQATKHPEAKTSRKQNSARQDGIGGI